MKGIYWVVLMAAFLTGCSVTPTADISPGLSHLDGAKLKIQPIQTDHYGSSQGQALGRSLTNARADNHYLARLDQECLRAIAERIDGSAQFSLSEDDGGYALQLRMAYKVASVLPAMVNNQIIALHIDWTVLDARGAKVATITTIVRDDSSPEAYPNTRDPRYFDSYLKLAERSTEDFLARISGQPPRWGQRRVDTW